ncbi:MAG: polyphosphate polymerase domain-containing protein [Pontiellaceae bacterium]|nr:polyphosphate polymerase domain-containing protein [Pontiellaceae bacterium]MBN2784898.1 polyphosphate polymerase domain-containing protein [Pontiellaceae bacterium]
MSTRRHIQQIKDGADFSTELDRFEAKYIIPRSLVEPIKEFIKPYCVKDRHCEAAGGHYYIVTIQYDTPSLSLHYAKEWELAHRFKLRVRTYGKPPGHAPVFMEIKRRYFDRIIKSRACLPFDAWQPGILQKHVNDLNFKTVKEREAFREFVRLHNEIGAEPRVIVRYCREAFTGIFDHYARITFDSQLCYQPVRDEFDWGRNGRFISMDSGIVKRRKESSLILEVKCTEQVPTWMIELVQHFELVRVGNCKYSTAIWMEKLMMGRGDSPFADEMIMD